MTSEKEFQKLTSIFSYYFTDQNSITTLHLTGREIGNYRLFYGHYVDFHISSYGKREEWGLGN